MAQLCVQFLAFGTKKWPIPPLSNWHSEPLLAKMTKARPLRRKGTTRRQGSIAKIDRNETGTRHEKGERKGQNKSQARKAAPRLRQTAKTDTGQQNTTKARRAKRRLLAGDGMCQARKAAASGTGPSEVKRKTKTRWNGWTTTVIIIIILAMPGAQSGGQRLATQDGVLPWFTVHSAP